jgi:hypothetical protein
MIAAGLASNFLTTMAANDATAKQAEAEQEELRRQQEENNRIAAEEASDRAIEADKAAASAIAAMEAIGGFGSANDDRLQMEIAGVKGLDLARIEGNRTARNAALKASQQAVRTQAKSTIQQNNSAFLGSALSAGSSFFSLQGSQQRRGASVENSRQHGGL